MRTRLLLFTALLVVPSRAHSQQVDSLVSARGDSVTIHLVDVDLRAAVQALSRYMDRPVVYSGGAGNRVTLETPRPVARRDVARLLRGLLETQGMDLVSDTLGGIYRLKTRDQSPTVSPSFLPGGGATGTLGLYVIHLRHAKASEVAATVNALYGRASALGEIGQRTDATLSQGLTQNLAPPVGAPPLPQALAGTAGRNASLGGETTIVPDTRANSLLIRAARSDFTLIQAVVTELDVRPLQVLIEVVIAEVRRDRTLDFGVDLKTGRRAFSREPGGTTAQVTNTAHSLGDFVLSVMDLGRTNIDATIRAAASRGDVNILSRPILLAANNERAVINVGSQRPFVQVARVLPTDNTARDQVVQYKDVGTKLQIVPTISADGFVMLQVAQEINAATAEQQFNAPVISTRSVETRLLVKDGQTVVLGGIADRLREHTQSGIPILSAIPWLGALFGHVTQQNTETELFIFLTPRIIASDADAESITAPLRERARSDGHE